MNSPPAPRRVAVIGDIGGHLDALVAELRRLGADPASGRLPHDLVVVQVGDLIHRGPDSAGVVALVDDYLTSQPEQWVQLVGNHEAQYLRDPAFAWPERLEERVAQTLNRWWAAGLLRPAATVQTASADYLLTHAGLTRGFWMDVLGAPRTASGSAAALLGLARSGDPVLFRSGQMLGGRRANLAAGPLWAQAETELVPSWLRAPMPFSQIHGHTAIHRWARSEKQGSLEVTRRTLGDPSRKHETTRLDGGVIVGVDPGHGNGPAYPWEAFVVEGTVG